MHETYKVTKVTKKNKDTYNICLLLNKCSIIWRSQNYAMKIHSFTLNFRYSVGAS